MIQFQEQPVLNILLQEVKTKILAINKKIDKL